MVSVLVALAVVVYAASSTFLAVQGLHSLWLLWRFRRARRGRAATPASLPVDPPTVLVQLPVFNERDVVERLVAAVGALAWPVDRLRIQLLDDSTDDSWERGERAIAQLRQRGLAAMHVRRSERQGFKAGALAHGLQLDDAHPDGPAACVAIFDADFVPAADFLLRTVPLLCADPGLAFVQARWDHLNADASLLTRVQALGIDGHFAIEQAARAWSGLALNFNGTCGVWARAAIDRSGGWQGDTLTEDLDLSYRAHLAGYRGAFAADVAVPGELPPTLEAWRAQQFRWAKGSLQTARKLLPAVFRSDWSPVNKIAAALHLLHYLVHPAILASLLAAPLAAIGLRELPTVAMVFGVGLLLAGLLPPVMLYVASQRALGRSPRRLLALPALMSFGTGLALSNARAAWQALRGARSSFVRTPKHGGGPGSYRAEAQAGIGELLVFVIGAIGCFGVFASRTWWLMPAVAVYVLGFLAHGLVLLRHRLADAIAADHRPAASPWPLLAFGALAVGAAAAMAQAAERGQTWRAAPWLFATAGCAAGLACAGAVRWLQRVRASWSSLAIVVGVGVALQLLATHLPLSDDVHRYFVEGRQWASGQNPYAIPPTAAALPGVDVALVNHAEMTSIYPPLMLQLHAAAVAIWPQLNAFRVVAMLATAGLLLATVALLLARGGRPTAVVALLWHPVLFLFAAGEAHHDVVAALLVAAALLALSHRWQRSAVVLATVAVLLKPFALVALPFVLHATSWRLLWLPPFLALLAYLPFADAGTGLVRSLLTFGGSMQFHGPLEPSLRWLAATVLPGHGHVAVVRGVLLAALVVGQMWFWRRSRGQAIESRIARSAALLLMCLPTLHPWYFTLLVALLPFTNSPALLAWTVAAPLYWLHGVVMPPPAEWGEWSVATALAHLPFLGWMAVEAFGPWPLHTVAAPVVAPIARSRQ